MKRVRIAVLWVIIASLVMGGIWYFDAGGTGRFRRDSIVFPIMSTKAKIQLIGTEEQEIEKGFRAAREAMEKVVAVCNYFDPESELDVSMRPRRKRRFTVRRSCGRFCRRYASITGYRRERLIRRSAR